MPRYPNLDRSILEVALNALETRKADLDGLIESARRQLGTRSTAKTSGFSVPELSGMPAATPVRRRGRRKRVMSAEARARIAEAQRQRWAASRKQGGSKAGAKAAGAKAAKAKPAAKKRTMSPEARKRIAEAQRKRWAAVKKAT
jgi:hypothetical protein